MLHSRARYLALECRCACINAEARGIGVHI